jgi:hypothetical protein
MCFKKHHPSLSPIRSKRLGASPSAFDARRRKEEHLLSPNSSLRLTPAASVRGSFERLVATLLSFALTCLFACLTCSRAYGDVGVVLDESLDTSVARLTGSGHSAVYLSRICPQTPVKLRLCRPGEQASVISNYTTLGEDLPFEWNIVPLSLYLYGVEDPQHRPMFGSQKIKRILEERYRQKYLSTYCASESCRTSNKAEWREMVGASLSRSIYVFVIKTTVEQDLDLIAQFNSLPNENHFNGITRNCADFTRRVINAYFPGITGPEYINDFGITSPKAIARSFVHYALRHRELRLRVLHVAQVPGTIKRSSECRNGSEQLYRSKKLLVPMLIFANYELPVFVASYALTGRFNPEHQFEEHPAVEAAEVEHPIRVAKSENGDAHAEQLEAIEGQERAGVVGTSEEWEKYRKAFDSFVEEAVREEIIPERGYLNRFFKYLDEGGTLRVEGDGALWMQLSDSVGMPKVGLSASNILASGSDSQLAYELFLTRAERVLKSPKHSRETMLEFKKDWALLQYAHMKSAISAANTVMPAAGTRSTIMLAGDGLSSY